MMRAFRHIVGVFVLWVLGLIAGYSQCTNYVISVTSGFWPGEVSWQIVNSGGNIVASGGAPATVNVCLNNGNYTLYFFDSYGDGWNGAIMTIRCTNGTNVYTNLTLNTGSFGSGALTFNGSVCGAVSCPPGTTAYTLQITTGSWPGEVSWNLSLNSTTISSGGATSTTSLCLAPGCYTFNMYDSFGDGWNGAQYTLLNSGGSVLFTGTLSMGSFGSVNWAIGGASCGNSGPVTASDCVNAVNVCTNLSFSINPNGFGLVNEIPQPGSLSNPFYDFGDGILSPWGTDNFGCLLSGETNSTWMVVNIWQGGTLTFTFGGLNTQTGYYDWIMYPYGPNTCQQIYNNQIAPVRCNWNLYPSGGTGLASSPPAGGYAANFEPPLAVQTGQQYLIVFSNWSSVSTSVPLQFGGTAVVSCQSLSVATDLLSFTCRPQGSGSVLNWSTASESQTDYYILERSANGFTDWQEVGRVKAAGESFQRLDYSMTDEAVLTTGTWYYRLMELETNGIYRKIEDCAVDIVSNAEGWIIPNPVKDVFRLPAWMANEEVQVLDLTGREVPFMRRHECAGCQPELELIQNVPGVYLLRLVLSGESRRFVCAP